MILTKSWRADDKNSRGSNAFTENSFRINTKGELTDVVDARRERYLQHVSQLAAMDQKGLDSLGLPEHIKSDVEAMRAVKIRRKK